jgi:hypothetical protein
LQSRKRIPALAVSEKYGPPELGDLEFDKILRWLREGSRNEWREDPFADH